MIHTDLCLQTSSLMLCSGLEMKAALLCQGDLDPPDKSSLFLLVGFQTTKFLIVNDFIEQIFSVSEKAVLTPKRGLSQHCAMALSTSYSNLMKGKEWIPQSN